MSDVNSAIMNEDEYPTPVLTRSDSSTKRLRDVNAVETRVKTLISDKCTDNTIAQKHLFDVERPDDLLEFAKLNNYLEILDSSHDLQRNNEQTNPLYEYYLLNIKMNVF